MSGYKHNSELLKYAHVIYHAHCADGFGAAWAFMKTAGMLYFDHTDYVAMSYGEQIPAPPAPLKDTILFIVDFSFPRAQLLEYAQWYAEVYVLDHHKTAIEALEGWEDKPDNIYLELDTTRSGAMITWQYFGATRPAPDLILYIQDRDLWKWELYKSEAINEVIGFSQKTFDAYDSLEYKLRTTSGFLIQVGETLLEQNKRHVASIISATCRPINIAGNLGLSANCPGQFASAAGNELAVKSGTYGACWYQDKDGNVKFSLRSNGDYDVSAIAKQFGGGGHKNAAGFTLYAKHEQSFEGILIFGAEPEVSPFSVDELKPGGTD
jgi:uncharacterized protein